jgi:hypothetical protein
VLHHFYIVEASQPQFFARRLGSVGLQDAGHGSKRHARLQTEGAR